MLRAARVAIVVVALAGVLLCVYSLSKPTRAPRMGIATAAGIGTHQFARISGVLAGSAAERAGIRAGDRLRYATQADEAAVAAHIPATVHLQRPDASVVNVELARAPRPLGPTVFLFQGILMSLLALLLAVRAWRDVQARWLALGFLWIAVNWSESTFSGWPAVALNVSDDVLIGVGMIALVCFATGWSAMPSTPARLVRIAAVVLAAGYIAVSLPGDSGFFNNPLLVVSARLAWMFLALLMIGGLAISTVRARGNERRRIGWILVTMTIAFAPFVGYELLAAAGGSAGFPTWTAFAALALPFGFGYAMLRHRVVDLGFALNRAAVFAATTALLVGLFGALQWGADQLLVRATGAQDFTVQMVIAVVVLYAVRTLRVQTDAAVARVFFATRRRRIDAIVALGSAVEAVESAASLGPYIVEQLRVETAIESALYVETEDAYVRVAGGLGPERVGRDNATVIALRATRAAVPIRAESDLIGAVAFPLSVRGRLRGALVCALPAQDAEFAPDEAAALAGLAARTCVVRDDLLAEQLQRERDELRRALARFGGGSSALLGLATAPLSAE
jgi:hypothetical protein